jgi:hypothetical protein
MGGQMRQTLLFLATAILTGLLLMKAPAQTLPGTAPLKEQGDFALQMVYGIDRYLGSEWALARSIEGKSQSIGRVVT